MAVASVSSCIKLIHASHCGLHNPKLNAKEARRDQRRDNAKKEVQKTGEECKTKHE